MKRNKLIIFCCFFLSYGYSQDLANARKIIDTLTSPFFWGRGYTKNGMSKAADFLVEQYKTIGLQSFDNKSFLQTFSYPANTFPGKMEVSVNGKALRPGFDFIIGPASKGIKGKGILVQQDSMHFIDRNKKVMVSMVDKLTWSISDRQENFTFVDVDKKSVPDKPSSILINIENKFISSFSASNVCGYVKGTTKPDSLLVITAHYDHLGGMGRATYFPGANDDASGIALLLSLARHYAGHPPTYSVAFVCFAGEEAGLVGSKYFSENPLFPLVKIRFLLNVDLVGTGDEGITVVNGTIFREEYRILDEINDREKYFVKIKSRGKAANSDHYWFTEKGVPSFFIYALGGIKAYHDVYDKASTLPLTEFEDLFKLAVRFNGRLMKG